MKEGREKLLTADFAEEAQSAQREAWRSRKSRFLGLNGLGMTALFAQSNWCGTVNRRNL